MPKKHISISYNMVPTVRQVQWETFINIPSHTETKNCIEIEPQYDLYIPNEGVYQVTSNFFFSNFISKNIKEVSYYFIYLNLICIGCSTNNSIKKHKIAVDKAWIPFIKTMWQQTTH